MCIRDRLYNEFISLPIGLLKKLHDAYTSTRTTDAEQRAFEQASLYTAKNLLAIDEKRGTSEKHGDCGVERLKYAKAIFAMYGVPALWFDKVIVDKGTFKAIFGNYPTEEGYLDDVLAKGADAANEVAEKTVPDVRDAMGFMERA